MRIYARALFSKHRFSSSRCASAIQIVRPLESSPAISCPPVEQVAAAAVPKTRRLAPKHGTRVWDAFHTNCIAITA